MLERRRYFRDTDCSSQLACTCIIELVIRMFARSLRLSDLHASSRNTHGMKRDRSTETSCRLRQLEGNSVSSCISLGASFNTCHNIELLDTHNVSKSFLVYNADLNKTDENLGHRHQLLRLRNFVCHPCKKTLSTAAWPQP